MPLPRLPGIQNTIQAQTFLKLRGSLAGLSGSMAIGLKKKASGLSTRKSTDG
jgi:hypothetical protein